MDIIEAVKQLNRSERGQLTAKLLLQFLDSSIVKGLDAQNEAAVTSLVAAYMTGTGQEAQSVLAHLTNLVESHAWLHE